MSTHDKYPKPYSTTADTWARWREQGIKFREEAEDRKLEAELAEALADYRATSRGADSDGKVTKHTPGLKLDAGKAKMWTMLGQFPRALRAIVSVLEAGAVKYPSPENWKQVPDAAERYRNALIRHMFPLDGERDEHSGSLHIAHVAANALFILETVLEEEEIK